MSRGRRLRLLSIVLCADLTGKVEVGNPAAAVIPAQYGYPVVCEGCSKAVSKRPQGLSQQPWAQR